MAHPLFARLERQVNLVRRELANATEANRRFLELKKRYPALYHEWSHNASLADGASAIYTGLESVLDAIGNEIDEYTPRGDASHADLVDGMALAVDGVRPAVLSEASRELMHEARKFRHVVRHKYGLELKQADVSKNFRLAKKLVPAFEKDYRRFVRVMLEEEPAKARRRKA